MFVPPDIPQEELNNLVRWWHEWKGDPKRTPAPNENDNTALFEARFESVLNRLLGAVDQQLPSSVDTLKQLTEDTYRLQKQTARNLRNRQTSRILDYGRYGLDEGKQTDLLRQTELTLDAYLRGLDQNYLTSMLGLEQLQANYELQDFAQKLGSYGVLADLLRITPVNPEALKQQALAAGQLASMMTAQPTYYQPNTTSILLPLLGAGVGYFLGGGLGGATLGLGIGSLLGSLF